jgi:type II secretory pathway pseudopilin PulG
MQQRTPSRRPPPSEEGYVLLAVIFLLFLLLISLSIAAPKIARQIQRDHEVETMNRGKQYIRAIQLYYHKFHAYPPSVDALVNTNSIRFLRKRYPDPITGKDDWKPVLFGQNKAPTAMGFFGQPLLGSTISGIGPSGGSGIAGLSGSSGSSGSTLSGGALGSIFNSGSADSSNPQTPSTGGNSGSGSNSTGGTDTGGGSASGSSGTTSGSGTIGATGSTGTSSFGSSITGQTFGGAGIIGFSPNSPKQSILIYKTKTKYDEWEFVYDPIIEQKILQVGTGLSSQSGSGTNPTSGGLSGQSGSGTTTGPASGGFGTTGFGSSGSGSSGSSGSTSQ